MKSEQNTADQVSDLFSHHAHHGNRYFIPYAGEKKDTYLTHREAVIVSLLINGKRAKQIAFALDTSLHTVNTHLSNIKSKLNCQNIFQLGLLLGNCLQKKAG